MKRKRDLANCFIRFVHDRRFICDSPRPLINTSIYKYNVYIKATLELFSSATNKIFPIHFRMSVMPSRTIISIFYCLFNNLFKPTPMKTLTHWGRVTHICVGNLTIIGSDNGLSPGRRQAIIWTSAGILLIGPLGTNFSEILIGIQTFSFKKMHLKISSAKWRPFCPGLNVLTLLVLDEENHRSLTPIPRTHPPRHHHRRHPPSNIPTNIHPHFKQCRKCFYAIV